MFLIRFVIFFGVAAIGLPSAYAADMELQIVDKNCWVEIYEDSNFDTDDPHIKIQGPKELATLKNLQGKDWANDIESLVFGPNAVILAYEENSFTSTEINFVPGQRVPNLSKLDMANDVESMKITCGKN